MGKKLTTEEFITRSKIIHNNKYEYHNIIYINGHIPINIYCTICNEYFQQKPHNHLMNRGCPKCALNNTSTRQLYTTDIFISKAITKHGNTAYDYSQCKYIDSKTKIHIICNTCKCDFNVLPSAHLRGYTCPICANNNRIHNNRKGLKFFIDKAIATHGNLYSYENVEYINNHTKVEIYCKQCKRYFIQNPKHHTCNNGGCPTCKNSKGEYKIRKILNTLKIEYIPEYKFEGCTHITHLPFDFYLPDYNICIEYDGIQHFKSVDYFGGELGFINTQIRDDIKNKYCENNNIKLIRIPYWDYENIEEILTDNIE